MIFKRIDHVEIVTDQLDRTEKFYTEVLGFAVKIRDRIERSGLGVPIDLVYLDLAGCGKSRDFGETVMKRARNGNPGLIKSTGYEGAKGDESGWKHHRPTFSAAC